MGVTKCDRGSRSPPFRPTPIILVLNWWDKVSLTIFNNILMSWVHPIWVWPLKRWILRLWESTKTLHSKFLDSRSIQASKILLPIDFPPRETYGVLEFWQLAAKKSALPLKLAIFFKKIAKIQCFWVLNQLKRGKFCFHWIRRPFFPPFMYEFCRSAS